MDRPRIISWNWRAVFDTNTLGIAQRLLRNNMLVRITMNRGATASATAEFKNGFRAKCIVPASYTQCAGEFHIPADTPSASPAALRVGQAYFSCNCSASLQAPCSHQAALLLHWEKERGSFSFRETAEEKQQREKREAGELPPIPAVPSQVTPAQPVLSRLSALRRPQNAPAVPPAAAVSPVLPSVAQFYSNLTLPDHLYFDLPHILDTCKASESEFAKAKTLLASKPLVSLSPSVGYAPTGEQTLSCKLSIDADQIRFTLARDHLTKAACTRCHISYNEKSTDRAPFFCCHQLIAFRQVIDYICRFRPGDATDKNANALMTFLSTGLPSATEDSRHPTIDLELALRFHAATAEPSLIALVRQGKGTFYECFRPIRIAEAMQEKGPLYIYGTTAIDFERNTLSPESMPALKFIQFIYDSYARSRTRRDHTPNHGANDAPLITGIILDHFYDLTCGQTLSVLQESSSHVRDFLQVGPCEGLFPLSVSLSEKNDQPVLLLEGMIPYFLYGTESAYMLSRDKKHLIRLTKEDEKLLSMFQNAADDNGLFQYVIGHNRLMYFCHELIPLLRNNPLFALRDYTPEGFLDSVPKEAHFIFYLTVDHPSASFRCLTKVSYDSQEFPYPYTDTAPEIRDLVRESRVSQTIQRYFPSYEQNEGCFSVRITDDTLYRILHDALPELEHYGTVLASSDFPELHVRGIGSPYLNVSVDADLIHVSLLSEDLSEEELLALLSAYRRKQHFHRLRSGDFIDLEMARAELEELISITEMLDLSPEEVIERTASMPRSRAAFVSAMMHTHDRLVRTRDSHFQQLVDDFDRIRNTVFEVPASLRSVMRPYQVAGYSWLRMLASAGFGGILADDMGLGKTLQMLSALLAMREEGATDPFLIICPASLVYNWREEIRRFTPTLSCTTLTGSAAVREQMLRDLQEGNNPTDIYIASYDVVRRDISLLQPIQFHVIVLDEAQYIKTTKANITKAVKILKGTHRFALTGTPIENRLSELWSIFDFLMPGFLFSADTFRSRYDVPITQMKDESVTELLAHMTAPFIMRRLKSDVLRELPEKLEEIRTAVFDDEQRRLYDAQVYVLRRQIETANTPQERFGILPELLKLRQICCDPSLLFEDYHGESAKRAACLDLIESAIDSGHRILLFSQFTSMLDLLGADLKAAGIPFYLLTGSTTKEQRLQLVHDFNLGDTPVFLISLKAGGTGLNLIGADVVIHYDPWWNLAAQNQATDRAHRIGQTRQVTVFKLIAAGTIEERIIQMQEAKKDLADAILEGRSESLLSMSHEEMLALLT
ncbi:MAG: SNF2 helicase associated domain-containing protein [Clostridia bacterium]|nr:SNF2 helicase associated domain-containing protein [Clostridia bacterium]